MNTLSYLESNNKEKNISRGTSAPRSYEDLLDKGFPSLKFQVTEIGTIADYYETQYLDRLPENIDIFLELNYDCINEFKHKEVIIRFLGVFRNELVKLNRRNPISKRFEKLTITKEDEGISINWLYNDFRIYFVFEKDIDESSYGIVAEKDGGYLSQSALLNPEGFSTAIKIAISFAIGQI